MTDWRTRLEQRMADLGLKAAEVVRRAGVNATFLTDVLKRGQNPSIENLAKVAHAVGLTLGELYEGEGSPTPEIEIIGMALGEAWRPTATDTRKVLSLDILARDLVWLQVEGDALLPHYRDGDVIGGPSMKPASLHNYIGQDVIAQTGDGERFVRVLQRGQVRGRFNLRSFNSRAEDIENVGLAFAAPIQLVLRNLG